MRVRPRRQGPEARQQLAELERLDEIVVGARIETADAIVEAVTAGQHQMAPMRACERRRMANPSCPGRITSSTMIVARAPVPRRPAFGDGVDVEQYSFEAPLEKLPGTQVVVDEEHTHRHTSLPGRARRAADRAQAASALTDELEGEPTSGTVVYR